MLLIDEVKEKGGIVFTLDNDTVQPASIVVEVPTKNQTLYYGAGNLTEKSSRIDRVYATADGILVHKENGDELVVPVHLSGKYQVKIYQFGDDQNAWEWKQENGETEISPCHVS